jgi:hypothetical protein
MPRACFIHFVLPSPLYTSHAVPQALSSSPYE